MRYYSIRADNLKRGDWIYIQETGAYRQVTDWKQFGRKVYVKVRRAGLTKNAFTLNSCDRVSTKISD